jgi:hypothetical protein
MRGASQFVRARQSRRGLLSSGAVLAFVIAVALSSAAQVPGAPPSTNQVGGHFLAPPPSVTSIGGPPHLPPPLPSVTSIPNYGYRYHNGTFNGHYSNHGYRNGGWAYAVPYYYPMDDPAAYGYDYVGGGSGPDVYSGPPLGPDQNPHIVVEQPPSRPYNGMYETPQREAYAAPPPPPAPDPVVDAKPGEPSVLVFRDGHRQEVTNYAIMGDNVYVFDKVHKKIALADLDVPATIKANDDRGLEFKVPASPTQKKNPALPQTAAPDEHTTAPASVASAMP